MLLNVSPPVVKIKDEKELTKIRSNPVSFVLLYKSDDDYKAYSEIAEKYQDSIRFGATKNADLLKFLPENTKLALVWFNDGEPEIFGAESKKLESIAAEKWIKARKYPHFVQFDALTWRHFSTAGKPIVVGVMPTVPASANTYVLNYFSREIMVYGLCHARQILTFFAIFAN